jgi:hypothetical protein
MQLAVALALVFGRSMMRMQGLPLKWVRSFAGQNPTAYSIHYEFELTFRSHTGIVSPLRFQFGKRDQSDKTQVPTVSSRPRGSQ